MIPYSWYINNWRPSNFDDMGNTNTQKFSESEWNAMTPDQQSQQIYSNTIGGGSETQQYKDIVAAYHQKFGGSGDVALSAGNKLNDPSKDYLDPSTGTSFTTHDNFTKSPDRITPATGILTVLGAGGLGNLLGLGGAGATDFAGLGAGALEGGATGAAGGLGGGAAGNVLGGAGALGAGSLAGGQAGAGAAGSSGGLLSGMGDLATSAGRWALNNPLQLAGLLQAGSGLISGSRGGSSGSYNPTSTYNTGKGGQGQPFYVNPTTQAQLQRYQRGA